MTCWSFEVSNVFPSAVENIIKSFPEVVEHRLTVNREGNLDMLSIEIEDQLSSPARVAQELQVRLVFG